MASGTAHRSVSLDAKFLIKTHDGAGANIMKAIASWTAILTAAISAGLGLYAALGVEVRDNIDAFIGDLQRQSYWASLAAAAAGISVLAQALDKLRK
jgi:hypothetical protein